MWLLSAILIFIIFAFGALSDVCKTEKGKSDLFVGITLVGGPLLALAIYYLIAEQIDDIGVLLAFLLVYWGAIVFVVYNMYSKHKSEKAKQLAIFNHYKEVQDKRCSGLRESNSKLLPAELLAQILATQSFDKCMEFFWSGVIGVRVDSNDIKTLFEYMNEYSSRSGNTFYYIDSEDIPSQNKYKFDLMPLIESADFAKQQSLRFSQCHTSYFVCSEHIDGGARHYYCHWNTDPFNDTHISTRSKIVPFSLIDSIYKKSNCITYK